MPADRGGPVAAGRPVRPAPVPGYRAIVNSITNSVGGAVRAAAAPVTPSHAAPAPARSQGAPPSHTDITSSGPGYGSAQANRYKATEALAQKLAGFDNSNLQGILRGAYRGPFSGGPFSSIEQGPGGVHATNEGPIGQLQMLDLFNQDWANLKAAGLVPKGETKPSLAFDAPPEALAFTEGKTVHVSPFMTSAATAIDDTSGRAWAREGLIHEIAHTMQSPKLEAALSSASPGAIGSAAHTLTQALLEGGAQAYADAATPRVLGPQPVGQGAAAPEDGYGNFTRLVRQLGPGYYMRGQFR